MNDIQKKWILILMLASGIQPGMAASIREYCDTLKSMSSFHMTIAWNTFWYGQKKNFDEVVASDNAINIQLNVDGSIASVADNKQSPILLGRIPRTQQDIDSIRGDDQKVGIYTFNKDFEKYWAGLEGLRKENDNLSWHCYDTIDYNSPNQLDLTRLVRDLESRDQRAEQKAYVHCKAGRGRSATGVAAYILYLAQQDGKLDNVSVDTVEAYLQSKRPQVKLGHDSHKQLAAFHTLLKEKSFNTLLEERAKDIAKRDAELLPENRQPLMQVYRSYIAVAASGALAIGFALVSGFSK